MTALGAVTNKLVSKRLKSMNMKLLYFDAGLVRGNFAIFGNNCPGPTYVEDYVSKHYLLIHYRAIWSTFLTPKLHLDLFCKMSIALATQAA